MKKIISLCLIIVIALSCTVFADASSVLTEDMLDYLVSCGFPEDYFIGFEESDIQEMYSTLYGQNIVYLGTETVSMRETYNQSSSAQINTDTIGDNGGEASINGVISSSDMTFTITTIANTTYDANKKLDKVNMIYVYVNYNWTSGKPACTWNDGITVNWNSSVFTFKSGSFVARDYKRTHSNNGEWKKTKEYKTPSCLNTGGLGYYAYLFYNEVFLGNNVGALQHRGSANFTLLPAKSPMYLKTGASTTAINANYLHNKNAVGTSVGFSKNGLGVSVSVSGLSDSVATATNVSFSYN